jgi:hypothetical protein
VEAGGKPRQSQDPHGILLEGLADMTQHPGLEVATTTVGVDQHAVLAGPSR